VPVGIDLEQAIRFAAQTKTESVSENQFKQGIVNATRHQFAVLREAARDCDYIVGGGIPQIATRTVAEILRVPCVSGTYCPVVYPSPQHLPPPMTAARIRKHKNLDCIAEWLTEDNYWNELYRDILNEERKKFSLGPVESVMRHVLEGQTLLAADATIFPAPTDRTYDTHIWQPVGWADLRSPTKIKIEWRQNIGDRLSWSRFTRQ